MTATIPKPFSSHLYTTRRPAHAMAMITELEKAYFKAHKRALPVELFMSDAGKPPHVEYGVNAYYAPEHQPAVDFLHGEVKRIKVAA